MALLIMDKFYVQIVIFKKVIIYQYLKQGLSYGKFSKNQFFYWHEGEDREWIESMWACPKYPNYKIENIPFYVKEYALGDIVSVTEKDGKLYIDELIEESGHSTIRIVFLTELLFNKRGIN